MTASKHPPNKAQQMTEAPIALDMSRATQQQLRAIQNRADRFGITFEEAALQMLLELADKTDEAPKGALGRLLRFRLGI